MNSGEKNDNAMNKCITTFGFIVVMIWFLIHVPIQVLSCEFQQFLGPVKMLNDKVYSETVNVACFI